MKKITFADISIFLVDKVFHWRFWIAGTTRKSKIMKTIIDNLLFQTDDVAIIPNTKSININQKIESEGTEFLPTDVLKEVIKKCDDIYIMNDCLCRTSNKCKDYPQDTGCIFLGPTARKIPKHLCHKANKKEAIAHVNAADEAGLSHLIGRNKIDSMWMNVHPGKSLLTICHCCPCCCLWKVVPNLEESIQEKIYRLPGVSISLDEDKCKVCKRCLRDICLFKAIEFKDGKIIINKDQCRGCGHCANICKDKVISISYTDDSIQSVINRCYNLIEE